MFGEGVHEQMRIVAAEVVEEDRNLIGCSESEVAGVVCGASEFAGIVIVITDLLLTGCERLLADVTLGCFEETQMIVRRHREAFWVEEKSEHRGLERNKSIEKPRDAVCPAVGLILELGVEEEVVAH